MLQLFVSSLELFGIAVYAVTGALVASRKQMDIFGFMLLGVVTGVGGGSLRDVLLGALPVFWIADPVYVLVCAGTAVLVYFLAHIPTSRFRVLLWLDAVGLSFFCVVGADKALVVGTGAFVAVIMGVVTGTFGSIVRDVLGGEIPLLLRKEIYVTAALAGAVTFVALRGLGAPAGAPELGGFLVCFAIRGLALHFHWSLPVHRARAGRNEEELRRIGL